jgi:hypothetical protein
MILINDPSVKPKGEIMKTAGGPRTAIYYTLVDIDIRPSNHLQ